MEGEGKNPLRAASEKGLDEGFTEGAQKALANVKAVLDRTDEEPLRNGRIRLAGLAYSKKLFEDIAGEIRKLQGRK
jgi:hypothetical protein